MGADSEAAASQDAAACLSNSENSPHPEYLNMILLRYELVGNMALPQMPVAEYYKWKALRGEKVYKISEVPSFIKPEYPPDNLHSLAFPIYKNNTPAHQHISPHHA